MTVGLWRRFHGSREYTRSFLDGRAPALCLEAACGCLTEEWIFADEDDAPDLEAQKTCLLCDGGWLDRERDAFDLWKLLRLDPAPCELLAELATVRRLAGHGIPWRDINRETGSPLAPMRYAHLYPWQRDARGARTT